MYTCVIYRRASHAGPSAPLYFARNNLIGVWVLTQDQGQGVAGLSLTKPALCYVLGVPQGTVLSLMLFLLYINGPLKSVFSTTSFFADDSLLYRRIRTDMVGLKKIATDILQEDLSRLETWERDWPISFNPLKYEVIRISKWRTRITGSYSIYGHQLAFVKS